MLFFFILFQAIKSECTNYVQNTFNNDLGCPNDCIVISNSIFSNIHSTILKNCQLSSISFKECSFSLVESIIDSNYDKLQIFSFESNCCNNNEKEKSNNNCIKILSESDCQFNWNTFSGFLFSSGNKKDFISFQSPTIQIVNLNLTNNEGFKTATFISHPKAALRFNDVTFYGNYRFDQHICIIGPCESHSFDRINDNSMQTCFLRVEDNANIIASRVYMPNFMEIIAFGAYVWFVDSYLPLLSYPFIGPTVPLANAIVVDSLNTLTSSYFIRHLSAPECPTNIINLPPAPPHTVASSMKLKIAFSFIGGILLGVAVFLIIFFTVKYSIKCYRKKQDQKHPVFQI